MVTFDAQAALTVLGRRNPAHDAGATVDLKNTCVIRGNLYQANLTGANSTNTDLASADLVSAKLTGAVL